MSLFLEITRISTDDDIGTFGVMKWADRPAPFALTLEDPWKDNEKNVSCIPVGTYHCKKFNSPTHGATFQIMDVTNRTYILFHRGNTHINTMGCVLIGEKFHFLNGIPSIAASRDGWNEFWNRVNGVDGFDVVIKWSNQDA